MSEATTTQAQADEEPKVIFKARGLVKVFGRVVALDDCDLDLYEGEVLCVIGDNGAGKSSLIKCLSGAFVPDEGTMELDGQEVAFKRPQDAQEAGIETVYQTLAVSPALDIAANMYLGREVRRRRQVAVPGLRPHLVGHQDVFAAADQVFFSQAQVGIAVGLVHLGLLGWVRWDARHFRRPIE